MAIAFFYAVPNSILIFMFIVILISISLIGLYLFTIFVSRGFIKTFDDANTGLYTSAVTIAIAIIIAFVITNEWLIFSKTESNLVEEANVLYLLYENVYTLPDTDDIQILTIQYICSIINIEFPAMKSGQLPLENETLILLQSAILVYDPDPPLSAQELIIYENIIALFNQALSLRNQRLQASMHGIPNELWWVIIIGFILVMVMTWFIKGNMTYRIIMNAFVIMIYASLLFLVVALDYPFRGDFSLTADPFVFVLNRIPASC